MSHLMVSVSGVRGIYGDGLTDEIAEKFAFAFGTLYSGSIVVGRDSRKSGLPVLKAVVSGLRKAGADVIDIGLASTPTTEMAVTLKQASGGIIITASHNPPEWNGLKFLGPDGVFLDASEGAQLVETYELSGDITELPQTGTMREWDGADEHHIESIMKLDVIDSDLIAARSFSVCIDAVNGVGGAVCIGMLNRLGCTVHEINCEPTGEFSHGAEPVPENIWELCALVRQKSADIGFAVDPDSDRLSIVDERGEALGEEYSLALASDFIMGNGAKRAACNLSTSRMIDDIAQRYSGEVFRSAVGEINVVQKMRESGARIGGEGNGGIILPELHYGRDAVLGIALILQLMAEKEATISKLAGSIPAYCIVKEKIPITEKGAWKTPVTSAFTGEDIDFQDGVKIIYPDSWVHIRESNTEPIVRIIAEAPTEDSARKLIQKVYNSIE